jgi:hypothetical protein
VNAAKAASASSSAFLDTLEKRTFDFFWDTTNPVNGLAPDRAPNPPFSSVAAVGFALTAYPIGVERGYITRAQARQRTLTTLKFLLNAPQGPQQHGDTGYRGFFYHFLDMSTGARHHRSELSTMDTALLMGGVLTSQAYFDQDNPSEAEIRADADKLYRRVQWDWAELPSGLISMGWRPTTGLFDYGYAGYDEAMLLYILALGSPTHPAEQGAWAAFTSTYHWANFRGYDYVNFRPLFGYQYSQVWIDFRGIQDAAMRAHGIDYFENSRRATYAQRAYAIANPDNWKGYGADVWGLTASAGPGNLVVTTDGAPERHYRGYWARGISAEGARDDGTLSPSAAAGSIAFAPKIVLPALKTMRDRYGKQLFGKYGFRDAFNLTYQGGWFAPAYLGIDQGVILTMIENYRSGLIWKLLRKNPYIIRGLERAGFTGGWLHQETRTEATTLAVNK